MEQLLLTGDKVVEINLNYSFSYIKVRKIIVQSLSQIPSKDWVDSLISFSLLFKYSDKRQSIEKSNLLSLLPHLSPYQSQPVFNFDDFEIPAENVKNISSFSNYFSNLSISIKYLEKPINNVKVVVFFETSPGVEIVKNDKIVF